MNQFDSTRGTSGMLADLAYRTGRDLVDSGRIDEAADWFDKALNHEQPVLLAFYERALIEQRRGNLISACALTVQFLSIGLANDKAKMLPEQQQAILSLAHDCFATDRDAAAALYKEIRRASFATLLAELRIIEAMIDAGDIDHAKQEMQSLRARMTLDATGWFIQARLCHVSGDPDGALAAIRAVILGNPCEIRLHVLSCNHLINYGQPEAAQHFRQSMPPNSDLSRQLDLDELDLRLEAGLAPIERIAQRLVDQDARPLPDVALMDILRRFSAPEAEEPLVEKIMCEIGLALGKRPLTVASTNAILSTYMHRWAWKDADTFLRRLESRPELFNHPQIVFRRFQIACNAQEFETARQIYQKAYASAPIGLSSGDLIIGFLVATSQWDEAANRLLELASRGWSYPPAYTTVLLIAKQTNLHHKLIVALDGAANAGPSEKIARLRAVVIDDLCLKHGAHSIDTDERLSVSLANEILVTPGIQRPGTVDQMGYLCSDGAYLLGTMAFLASYALHNSTRPSRLAWTIYLGRGVAQHAGNSLLCVARSLGLRLSIVGEEALDMPAAGFREDFAFFNPGHALSRAAYLRLYAARSLIRARTAGRIFYLDSDVLCTGPIDDFLDVEFSGALLLARPDMQSTAIRLAAQRHGIKPGTYFNSGVLQFAAARPETAARLDRAIALSETEPERLMFVDQCALNIAFAGHAAPLETRFNHFMAPWLPMAQNQRDATFLHYVAKPKPWEAAYSREDLRAPWLSALTLLRAVLPPDAYKAAVAAANRWAYGGNTAGEPEGPTTPGARPPASVRGIVSRPATGQSRLISCNVDAFGSNHSEDNMQDDQITPIDRPPASNDAPEMPQTPSGPNAPATPMAAMGRVEVLSPDFAMGWAAADAKGQFTPLFALLDGEVIGVSSPHFSRPDLDRARRDGRLDACVFVIIFASPVPAGKLGAIQIVFAFGRGTLPQTKVKFDRTPPQRLFLFGSPRSGTSEMGNTLTSVLKLPWLGEVHGAPLFANAAHAIKGDSHSANGMVRFMRDQNIAESVVTAMKQAYFFMHGSSSFVDKTPGAPMIDAAPFISECFPDAHFIFLWRNPVANVLSRMVKFGGNFESHCRDWTAAMNAWIAVRKGLPHFLEIRQEDMLEKPHEVGASIAGYIGSPDMGPAIGASLTSGSRERTGAGVGKTSLSETDWTEQQVAFFCRVCEPVYDLFRASSD